MTVDQIIKEIRSIVGRYDGGDEFELYDQLLSEAEGWKMRYEELDQEKQEQEAADA